MRNFIILIINIILSPKGGSKYLPTKLDGSHPTPLTMCSDINFYITTQENVSINTIDQKCTIQQ